MPTPIITLPIHTIEQARALAGLLRAFIDGQSPDTNDGADWKPDPDLAGIAALYAHLDAGIASMARRDKLSSAHRVLVARKVETDSAGLSTGWVSMYMDKTIGLVGVILARDGRRLLVDTDGSGAGYWYSPDALDAL